jgi:hypothetical protein
VTAGLVGLIGLVLFGERVLFCDAQVSFVVETFDLATKAIW